MTPAPGVRGDCALWGCSTGTLSAGQPGASQGNPALPAAGQELVSDAVVTQTDVSGLSKPGTLDIPSGTLDKSLLPV